MSNPFIESYKAKRLESQTGNPFIDSYRQKIQPFPQEPEPLTVQPAHEPTTFEPIGTNPFTGQTPQGPVREMGGAWHPPLETSLMDQIPMGGDNFGQNLVADAARAVMGTGAFGEQIATDPVGAGVGFAEMIGEGTKRLMPYAVPPPFNISLMGQVKQNIEDMYNRPISTTMEAAAPFSVLKPLGKVYGAAGKLKARAAGDSGVKFTPVEEVKFTPTQEVDMGAGVPLNKITDPVQRVLGEEPKTSFQRVAKEAMDVRQGEVAVGQHETSLYAKGLKEKFPREVREDMTFYKEKTHNPLKEGDTFDALEQRLPDEAKSAVRDITKRIDTAFKKQVQSGALSDAQYVENYITHLWDIPKKKAGIYARSFVTKSPQGRKYATIAEGMDAMGVKPRVTDIADLVKYHENLVTQVVENRKLVKQMRKWKDPETGQPAIMLASQKGVPENYKMIDSRALALAVNPKFSRGVKVAVHPDIASPLRTVFAEPFRGTAVNIYEYANAIAKKSALSLSLFHHVALTESSLASLGIKGINPIKAYKTGLKHLKSPNEYGPMLRAGVQIGSTSDIALGKINKIFQTLETKTRGKKGAEQIVRVAKTFNEKWDAALWDNYHNGLKAYAFHELKYRALKKNPNLSIKQIDAEIAKVVNDAFGGQNWDRMMMHPKVRQALQWIWLAPDWTLSNIKIAGRAFETKIFTKARLRKQLKEGKITQGEFDAMVEGAGLRGKIGRRYWRNAATTFFLGTQMINQLFSGKLTWENEPGHEWDIQLPYTKTVEKNGRTFERRQYIKLGKQFREPIRWATEPLRIGGSKLSPVIQQIFKQIGGHSPGSGFPEEWVREKEIKGNIGLGRNVYLRMKSALGEIAPFTARGNNFAAALPVGQGMTPYKFINMWAEAKRNNDFDRMRKIEKAAKDNGIRGDYFLSLRRLAENKAKK